MDRSIYLLRLSAYLAECLVLWLCTGLLLTNIRKSLIGKSVLVR